LITVNDDVSPRSDQRHPLTLRTSVAEVRSGVAASDAGQRLHLARFEPALLIDVAGDRAYRADRR